jgi:hypothetical protein
MNLTTWVKTTLADARSSSAATQVEIHEPGARHRRFGGTDGFRSKEAL